MDETIELDESIQRSPGRPRTAVRWFPAGLPSPYQIVGEARSTVGRGSEVTMSLAAACVSRCHAEIYRQGPALVFHDLESTNGSYVNGQRVEFASLADGDVIRLGDAVGVVTKLAAEGGAPLAADLVEIAPGMVFGPGLAAELADLGRVAPSDLPIVIVGETGTGKEFLARAAHLMSRRRGALHAVNCAALPTALAEAELFGHARGAYTGAEQAGLGHVRAADGGTLFLDELPELPLPVQAKLLRVLQEQKVTPLGETRPVSVDLRIVVAGQQPLGDLVAAGKMRQDLAARLSGLVVTAPPLRDRRIDVGLLLEHYLALHAKGSPPAVDPRLLECALLYRWPGNVRELELLTRRLIALHGHEPLLRRSHLPGEIRASAPGDGPPGAAPAPAQAPAADRDEHDLRKLVAELRRADGNVSRAAAAAGLSRSRAYRLMGDRTAADLMATEPSD